MFKRLPGLGLDIGSKRIKLIRVKKRSGGWQAITFGSIATPAGTVESGNILDPEILGKEIKILVRDLDLQGKKVAAALGGQQFYLRNIIMPRMNLQELKEAVHYQAMSFLPIPIEEAAIDIFPLREFENEEGRKIEVFFLAVRKQQVENLESACHIAGLRLAVVEIEPLAIYRLLGENNYEVTAFLEIGSAHSYLAVFRGGILVFNRSLNFNSIAFFRDANLNGNFVGNEMENPNINVNYQYDYLKNDIIYEVKRSVEYYEIQNQMKDERIKRFILCGEGSAIEGFDTLLEMGLGREVRTANFLSRLLLPHDTSESAKNELKYEFAAALGLAAREVI